MPRKFANNYVKLFKDVDYTGTEPLSLFELNKLVKMVYNNRYKIVPSKIPRKENEDSRRRKGKLCYDMIMELPIISKIFFPFIHKYDVVCSKDS